MPDCGCRFNRDATWAGANIPDVFKAQQRQGSCMADCVLRSSRTAAISVRDVTAGPLRREPGPWAPPSRFVETISCVGPPLRQGRWLLVDPANPNERPVRRTLHNRLRWRCFAWLCSFELDRLPGSPWGLLVQRLAITDTAAHELRPLWHGNVSVEPFRQQVPERGLVPAEIVSGRIAMLPDAGAQFFDFDEKLVSRQHFEIFIHWFTFSAAQQLAGSGLGQAEAGHEAHARGTAKANPRCSAARCRQRGFGQSIESRSRTETRLPRRPCSGTRAACPRN